MPTSSPQLTSAESEKLPSTASELATQPLTASADIESGLDHTPAGQESRHESWPHIRMGGEHGLLHHVPRKQFWRRLRGKTREEVPGVLESLKAIILSSWLNIFIIAIPPAWAVHFVVQHDPEKLKNGNIITFALCFISTIPLESLLDFGGEQMSLYMGKDLGDLLIVTLNNGIEAALAIILLVKCELKLLQSTIAGVVLLHLLLVPGVAFLAGGARVWHQHLHPHLTQLNHTLLTIGVLSLLLPTAFFTGLNPQQPNSPAAAGEGAAEIGKTLIISNIDPLISDNLRDTFLRFSRGVSVLLLIVYVSSRFFLYNPPGDGNALTPAPDAPEELKNLENELAEETPKVNPWVCLAMLVITVAITGATAEFFVSSIEPVLEESDISAEFFGMVILPLVSFSGDATVAIFYFLRTICFLKPETPESLAKARAIDLSIQFTLWWMPFLVLLGWWTNRPLTLLFDIFEVAVLIGACFLVNYVTADAKTNWAEGVMMCAFYVMIVVVTWYYPGQLPIQQLLACRRSVAGFIEAGGDELGGE